MTDRLPTNKSKPKTKSKKQKVNDALLMITALGKKLPEQYKEELRDIYSSVKEI